MTTRMLLGQAALSSFRLDRLNAAVDKVTNSTTPPESTIRIANMIRTMSMT